MNKCKYCGREIADGKKSCINCVFRELIDATQNMLEYKPSYRIKLPISKKPNKGKKEKN